MTAPERIRGLLKERGEMTLAAMERQLCKEGLLGFGVSVGHVLHVTEGVQVTNQGIIRLRCRHDRQTP
jgi:hypothetical protein